MKPTKHEAITFLGVAISAVVAIAAILYYRNQAANAAQASQNTGNSGVGAFPYFQTAALPTSFGGGAGSNPTAATGSTTPDVSQLTALLQSQINADSQNTAVTQAANESLGLTDLGVRNSQNYLLAQEQQAAYSSTFLTNIAQMATNSLNTAVGNAGGLNAFAGSGVPGSEITGTFSGPGGNTDFSVYAGLPFGGPGNNVLQTYTQLATYVPQRANGTNSKPPALNIIQVNPANQNVTATQAA